MDKDFINKQWPGIRDALVATMLENLDWFNQEYRWPERNGKNESQTTSKFAEFSDNLRLADNPEARRESIKAILIWGNTIKPNTSKYDRLLDQFREQLPNCNNINLNGNDDQKLQTVRGLLWIAKRNNNNHDNEDQGSWRISSWSKILAAFKPGEFFIYDSRVSFALTYFCIKARQPCFWSFIKPRIKRKYAAAYTIFTNRFNANRNKFEINQSADDDIPLSYFLYHELLKTLADPENDKTKPIQDAYDRLDKNIKNAYTAAGFNRQQAIMAHIEKMLFMMKEPILGYPQN